MTIHLRRQFSGLLADGEQFQLPDATSFPYRISDVLPKIVLDLEEGKFTQNEILLSASQSYSVPLPANYDTSKRLAVTIRSENICKVVLNNGTTTSTFLLKSTNGTTLGDHPGLLVFQDLVSTLTISVPATFDDAFIDYFIWEIPDLADPDSYRTGNLAFGYVVN